VLADEKLTAFVELKSAVRACSDWLDKLAKSLAKATSIERQQHKKQPANKERIKP
jgi:hypothetical protein